jgi:hypothetical protein
LAQGLIGLALDRWGLPIRFQQAAQYLEQLRAHPHEPMVLCLGSSRFGCALHPNDLTAALREATGRPHLRVQVAAVGGGDALTAECQFRAYLAAGVRPELVVLELCPESVCHGLPFLEHHLKRQFTWADWPDWGPEIWQNHLVGTLAALRLNPLYSYRNELRGAAIARLKAWLGPWWPAEASAVYRPPTWQAAVGQEWFGRSPTDRTIHGTRAVAHYLRGYRVGGCVSRALERLLERCRAEAIPVCLVMPPVAADHRRLYTPEIERPFRAYVAGLRARYGVRVIDGRDRLPDAQMLDNHHATLAGARAFSAVLAADVLPGPLTASHEGGSP